MIKSSNVYGAKADVFIKYDKNMKELASTLHNLLSLPEFRIETDMDPPHEEFAMTEAMGFETWLFKSEDSPQFNFHFKIRTEHSLNETVDKRMYDLSLWLARYISEIGHIETCVVDDAGNQTKFSPKEYNLE